MSFYLLVNEVMQWAVLGLVGWGVWNTSGTVLMLMGSENKRLNADLVYYENLAKLIDEMYGGTNAKRTSHEIKREFTDKQYNRDTTGVEN